VPYNLRSRKRNVIRQSKNQSVEFLENISKKNYRPQCYYVYIGNQNVVRWCMCNRKLKKIHLWGSPFLSGKRIFIKCGIMKVEIYRRFARTSVNCIRLHWHHIPEDSHNYERINHTTILGAFTKLRRFGYNQTKITDTLDEDPQAFLHTTRP
jgi:hypothetical protein